MNTKNMHSPILYKKKYRVPSTRKKDWDYASDGSYFITICTKNRLPWFGIVRDAEMHVSDVGKIIEKCWYAIPHHYKHVTLDAFQIMPDHIHGIVMIGESNYTETPHVMNHKSHHVETPYMASLRMHDRIQNDDNFKWQPRFHSLS